VVAVVTSDRPDMDLALVKAAAAEKLARFKQPKAIRLVEEFPRNAMGKVLKAELRKQFADLFPA
jgi:malonyl-CoA/methylmalonyl-CoA synthetase